MLISAGFNEGHFFITNTLLQSGGIPFSSSLFLFPSCNQIVASLTWRWVYHIKKYLQNELYLIELKFGDRTEFTVTSRTFVSYSLVVEICRFQLRVVKPKLVVIGLANHSMAQAQCIKQGLKQMQYCVKRGKNARGKDVMNHVKTE